MEQRILRATRFDLRRDPPLRYLHNLCALLRASQPLIALSAASLRRAKARSAPLCLGLCCPLRCVASGAVRLRPAPRHREASLRTAACLRHSAAEMAAGAFHLASLLLGEAPALPRLGGVAWCAHLRRLARSFPEP